MFEVEKKKEFIVSDLITYLHNTFVI
jgi:hypothetical protein